MTGLAAAHFGLTEDIDGTVTITGVTRDADATATLTLAYDDVDITGDGTLSVTVLAAGHTGTDVLPTATIPITASAAMNICGRTPWVRDAILISVNPPASDCTNVTAAQLLSIRFLDLSRRKPLRREAAVLPACRGRRRRPLICQVRASLCWQAAIWPACRT